MSNIKIMMLEAQLATAHTLIECLSNENRALQQAKQQLTMQNAGITAAIASFSSQTANTTPTTPVTTSSDAVVECVHKTRGGHILSCQTCRQTTPTVWRYATCQKCADENFTKRHTTSPASTPHMPV